MYIIMSLVGAAELTVRRQIKTQNNFFNVSGGGGGVVANLQCSRVRAVDG